MKPRRPTRPVWIIGTLAVAALVVVGVLVNVRVLTREDAGAAGSLSPVIDAPATDTTAAGSDADAAQLTAARAAATRRA
ncbi:MAG: hypothetical protein JWM86_1337, partial [Thermoleophilia bacterium]|nr:hypothetical protein [Thermoleophilia bacterium]